MRIDKRHAGAHTKDMTNTTTTTVTKSGNIITDQGVEPTAREIIAARAIRAARAKNIATRAARLARR